jgi:uncharacterized protein (TIGR04551 family)
LSTINHSRRRRGAALLPLPAVCAALILLGGTEAQAQRPGGFGPVGGPGGAGQKPDEKKQEEGPAEAAPKRTAELVVSPTGYTTERPGLLGLELHGYFRFRYDLLHHFNLGIREQNGRGGLIPPPFPVPLSERSGSPVTCSLRQNGADCASRTFLSGNLRLRLEPSIIISDEVRIHTQIDLLDNIVLGTTPDSYVPGQAVPGTNRGLSLFTNRQVPPISGVNSLSDSILVRRVYAEIRTEVGNIYIGRMPVHWGLGMLLNSGDPRANCGFDCNYGDTADRVMFVASPLRELTVGGGYEFTNSGLSSQNVKYTYQLNSYYYGGQPYNIDRLDDVQSLFLFIRKAPSFARTPQDEERIVRERADNGEVPFDIGFYFSYRSQGWDQAFGSTTPALGTDPTSNYYDYRADPTRPGWRAGRSAYVITSDLWARLLVGRFQLEAELALLGGNIGFIGGTTNQTDLTILQYGGVFRGTLRLLKDDLHINLEVGFASGDQNEGPVNGSTNYLTQKQTFTPGDMRLTQFRFNYDYRVDMILFREVLGTVANATYMKPSISYEFAKRFGAHLDIIYSLANVAVATPGNSNQLGVELDFGLYYKNQREGIFFAVDYGVLFPFAGLSRPFSIYGYRNASGNAIDANSQAAQAFRLRLVIPF